LIPAVDKFRFEMFFGYQQVVAFNCEMLLRMSELGAIATDSWCQSIKIYGSYWCTSNRLRSTMTKLPVFYLHAFKLIYSVLQLRNIQSSLEVP